MDIRKVTVRVGAAPPSAREGCGRYCRILKIQGRNPKLRNTAAYELRVFKALAVCYQLTGSSRHMRREGGLCVWDHEEEKEDARLEVW
jgi:hypothetical protein